MAVDCGKRAANALDNDHSEDAHQASLALIQMKALINHFERMWN